MCAAQSVCTPASSAAAVKHVLYRQLPHMCGWLQLIQHELCICMCVLPVCCDDAQAWKALWLFAFFNACWPGNPTSDQLLLRPCNTPSSPLTDTCCTKAAVNAPSTAKSMHQQEKGKDSLSTCFLKISSSRGISRRRRAAERIQQVGKGVIRQQVSTISGLTGHRLRKQQQ